MIGGLWKMEKENKAKDPRTKSIIMFFVYMVIGVIVGLIVSYVSLSFLYRRVGSLESVQSVWGAFSTNFTIETIIICLNLVLLIGILRSYYKDFKNTQSPFLLGLIIFLSVLVIQSFLSLPILNIFISVITIGVRQGFANVLLTYQSAIFSIMSKFFETIALIILFHLSNE